jgi:hypothetical protein
VCQSDAYVQGDQASGGRFGAHLAGRHGQQERCPAGKSQAGLPGLLISSSLHREEDNQGWKELRNQQPAGWVWPLL